MATENKYTGDNSRTNYAFTFPYLKEADVKCSLDGVLTTAFSLANATTVAFDSAPGTDVSVRVFRETDVGTASATYFPGSAIKSEDLNDNHLQVLYASEEAQERAITSTGGVINGDVTLGEDSTLSFEGATDDGHETKLTVVDPTADQTYRLPNLSAGTYSIVTTGDTATVTATMLAANSVDSSELVDGSVDLSHMSANSVDSDQYVDGSIDLVHMSANSVDSDQYVDGSIDSEHIGNDQIDSQHYVAGSINLEHMSANSVDSDQYVDGSIDLAHMSANSVDSDQYVDGSIDHVHLANDCIDGDNIQDDVINSEHYAAGSIDLEHMSANSVDSAQYVDGSIDSEHIANDQIDSQHYAAGSINLEHMSANSVDSDQYVDGSIDLAHMSANSVDSDQYVDGSIDTVHIADDAVDGTKLANNIDIAGTLDVTSTGTFDGNVVIAGNLDVNGTTTTIDTTNSTIKDALIELANGTSGSPSNDAGLVIERGSSDNAFIGWDESEDKFLLGTGSFTGASTGNLTVTTGTLVANIEGNVTGNTSGSSGSCTGNAAGLTGTPNITVGDVVAASLDISGNTDIDGTLEADAITVDGTALNEYIADTVGAMVGSNTETGITVTYEDGDNTLDFVVGTLNQDTTGTAAIATTVTVADESSDTSCNVLYTTAATGNLAPKSGTNLTFNSSSGALTATSFVGNLTGDVTGNTSGTAATVTGAAQSAITSTGTLTGLTVSGDVVFDNGTNSGYDVTFDASENALIVNDDVQLCLGTDSDLKFYHTGTHAYMNVVTGDLNIRTSGTESAIICTKDAGVATYYNGNKKTETSNTGITVTGTLVADNLDIGTDVDVDGTLEADAITVDGTALNEYIADTVGAMVSSNTETGVSVTYQDGDNTLDFELADDSVSLAKLAGIARGKIIYGDASGNPAVLAVGTNGQVLKTDGTDIEWGDDVASGGAGTFTVADESSDTTCFPVFVTAATGTLGPKSDSQLTYNASSGALGATTFVGNVDAVDGDFDGTLEADAITVDGVALNEYIADTVGAMVSGNTETNITVTYQDGDNTLDFAATDTNTTYSAGTGLGLSTTTFSVDAAQTGITSLLATDIKIGEDDQTKIDFETADEIHFYAANTEQVYLGDNIFGPQSDSDVDLGSSSVRWKDAYVDSITVTGEVDGASLDISGNADIDGTLEADAITVDGTALNEYIADTVGAMVGSNTESGITVAYQDADNTLDFTVGTLNQNTTGSAATLTTGRTIGMTGDVVWTSASFNGSGNVTGAATIQSGAVEHAMLAGDAVDGDNIADDSINSEHYVDASIDHAHLAADCVDGDNIADDSINSEHYVNASIDHAHLANDCVDGDNISDDSINSEHYVDASIDHQHLANDCVDGDNLADNACDSEHYTDGSIDHVHLAGDCIDGDNIQDDVINSEHIAAGAIDLEHMSSESVDEDNLHISNAGSNGQYLQKQSGNSGGLTWATVAAGGDMTPKFAVRSASENTTISSGTFTAVGFDTADEDSDSAYSLTDHEFTVPSGEGGDYWFSFHAAVDSVDSNDQVQGAIYKDTGSGHAVVPATHIYNKSPTNGTELSVAYSGVITLAAADKVQFRVRHNQGSNQGIKAIGGEYIASFSGFKLA